MKVVVMGILTFLMGVKPDRFIDCVIVTLVPVAYHWHRNVLHLTWPASLHVSHRSLRGMQIRFPVAQREDPRRCADGSVVVAVRPLKSRHGTQHATVR
jgi:hypothetical protein